RHLAGLGDREVLGELLEFVGAPRQEACTQCEARHSGDGEGAFLVITCSLVKQGSDTLVWVLQRELGGASTPRYHGKKSGCLVSLAFTFKQLISFVVILTFLCLFV